PPTTQTATGIFFRRAVASCPSRSTERAAPALSDGASAAPAPADLATPAVSPTGLATIAAALGLDPAPAVCPCDFDDDAASSPRILPKSRSVVIREMSRAIWSADW